MSWLGYAQNAKQSPVCPMIWLGKRNCWHGARSLRLPNGLIGQASELRRAGVCPMIWLGNDALPKMSHPLRPPWEQARRHNFKRSKIFYIVKNIYIVKIANYQNLTLWKLYIVKIVECQGKKDKSKKHALWRHCVVKECIGNTNFLQKHERARERPKHAFQCQRHGGGYIKVWFPYLHTDSITENVTFLNIGISGSL